MPRRVSQIRQESLLWRVKMMLQEGAVVGWTAKKTEGVVEDAGECR